MSVKHYDVKNFSSSASIGYLTKLAHTLVHERAAEAFAAHDLNFMQWIVLTKLHERTATTASDLCRAMSHDTGALTRLLDQLEELGYVERKRSGEDRRVVQLRLTAAGRRRSLELTPLIVDLLNDALVDFSKSELQELMRLMNKLIDGLRAREGAPS